MSFNNFIVSLRAFAAEHVLQADRAYLNSLINGSGDLLAGDVFERMEPMFERYAEDTEMFTLLTRAAEVYGDAAVTAAAWAMAGWAIADARYSARGR